MSTAASGDAARGRLIMKRQRQKKGGGYGDILGGPGRNRTIGTRIFNPRLDAMKLVAEFDW